MNKRAIAVVIGLIALQIAGFAIYGAMQGTNQKTAKTDSQLIESIKNDPEFSKMVQEALAQKQTTAEAAAPAASDEKGDKGDTGATGATGQKGAAGSSGSGQSSVTNIVQSGYPRLNLVTAPRDTTTAITAAQIKSGLLINVAPSDGTNEDRPMITLPSPVDDASIQGYIVHLLAEQAPAESALHRFGASLGYPTGMPATLADFGTLSPSTLNFSGTPLTVVYEINGVQKQAVLNQDYSSQPGNLLVDLFAEALTDESIAFKANYDRPGNGPNYNYAAVTAATGEDASISIIDPGAGDPLDLGSLTAVPGFTAYAGYDGGNLGIGELNDNNPVGSGYTHTWPDQPYGPDQQALIIVATSTGWRSLKTPYRSEFVNFSPTEDWFLTDEDKNMQHIVNTFDEEIFNIRTRLDALEP